MMKIKSIVLAIALAAVATFNSACATAQSSAPAPKKEIGLQLYSLRADAKKDLKGTLQKAADMGYTSIEAAGYGNGKFYGMDPV